MRELQAQRRNAMRIRMLVALLAVTAAIGPAAISAASAQPVERGGIRTETQSRLAGENSSLDILWNALGLVGLLGLLGLRGEHEDDSYHPASFEWADAIGEKMMRVSTLFIAAAIFGAPAAAQDNAAANNASEPAANVVTTSEVTANTTAPNDVAVTPGTETAAVSPPASAPVDTGTAPPPARPAERMFPWGVLGLLGLIGLLGKRRRS
jgi:hypothetical protein